MALKEQDVVLYSTDTDGNKVIQMPITRVENVEGAIKTINGVGADATGDYSLDVGVTSINGKVGAVTITEGGVSRIVQVTEYTQSGTKLIFTAPSGGTWTIYAEYSYRYGADDQEASDSAWLFDKAGGSSVVVTEYIPNSTQAILSFSAICFKVA